MLRGGNSTAIGLTRAESGVHHWYGAVFVNNRLQYMGPARTDDADGVKAAYKDILDMKLLSQPNTRAPPSIFLVQWYL